MSASFVRRCEQIIEEERIQFRWRRGDILILHNLACRPGGYSSRHASDLRIGIV
jgi:hypothetical protein